MEKEKYTPPPPPFPDKIEIAGLVAAVFPFICNFTTSSSSTVNGQVVAFQQTDYIAIAAGIIAILIGLSTIRLWSITPEEDLMKRRGMFALIIAVGIFQVVRGLGILSAI